MVAIELTVACGRRRPSVAWPAAFLERAAGHEHVPASAPTAPPSPLCGVYINICARGLCFGAFCCIVAAAQPRHPPRPGHTRACVLRSGCLRRFLRWEKLCWLICATTKKNQLAEPACRDRASVPRHKQLLVSGQPALLEQDDHQGNGTGTRRAELQTHRSGSMPSNWVAALRVRPLL